MTSPKAVTYFRVSSKDQQEKQSISLQKVKLEAHADEKGYRIVKEFQDDGISGESIGKRPGFQQCLEFVKKGQTDTLLVYMIDRIGRFKERRDRNQVIELLESSRTSVESPYDGLYRHDSETDLNDLEAALNESRRDNVKRSYRIREGQLANRLNGHMGGGLTPHGIRWTKKDGFRVDKVEKRAVEEIFEKAIEGWGALRIRNHLNSNLRSFPKRKDGKGKVRSDKWRCGHIRGIMHNDFYFTGLIESDPPALP